MTVAEKRLDALIEAGWDVLESDFNERVFLRWRKQAYDCVSELVGAEHPYAERLRVRIQRAEPSAILADVGTLTAARLWRFQDFTPCLAKGKKELEQTEAEASSHSDAAPLCHLKTSNLCLSASSFKAPLQLATKRKAFRKET